MIPTNESVGYYLHIFKHFNNCYFNNSLPQPKIKVTPSHDFVGYCSYTQSGRQRYNYTITLSSCYDMSEECLDGVILHEMIHLFLFYNHIEDNGDHGREFTKIAKRFNRDGWNISATVNDRSLVELNKPKKKHWWSIF